MIFKLFKKQWGFFSCKYVPVLYIYIYIYICIYKKYLVVKRLNESEEM